MLHSEFLRDSTDGLTMTQSSLSPAHAAPSASRGRPRAANGRAAGNAGTERRTAATARGAFQGAGLAKARLPVALAPSPPGHANRVRRARPGTCGKPACVRHRRDGARIPRLRHVEGFWACEPDSCANCRSDGASTRSYTASSPSSLLISWRSHRLRTSSPSAASRVAIVLLS